MDFENIKNSFHNRVPKCLAETFLLDSQKLVNLVDTIRSEARQKEIEKSEKGSGYIADQRGIFYEVLLSKNKNLITREEVISHMINMIKNWNTSYHPTEKDYRDLAENIIDYLQKENIIFFIKQ